MRVLSPGSCQTVSHRGRPGGDHVRHRIIRFRRLKCYEILNLQPKGGKAKPYQVKQIRQVILKYRLANAFDD